MSCGLVCCGVKTVAVGDEFTAQAMDYVKTSAQRALTNQLFIIVLILIAIVNFGVMGLALQIDLPGLSTMTALVAVSHSMLAGALYASRNPSMAVCVIIFPLTAIGGIAEGIMYAHKPSWQAVDKFAVLLGLQVVGETLFSVSAFWLATVSAAIGWSLNRDRRPRSPRGGLSEDQPLLVNAD